MGIPQVVSTHQLSTGPRDQHLGVSNLTDLNSGKLQQICLNHLDSSGFEINQRHDFEEIEEQLPGLNKFLTPTTSVTPSMSVAMNDFTEASAFWLTMEKAGKLVAVMAMRLDRLGRESISEFFCRAYSRHYPTNQGVSVSDHIPQVVRQITGDIVYMGDLFFAKEIRGSRANLMCFVHLAHALCFAKWQHDWTYAFHHREDVLSGYTDRYGFNNRWPGAQIWTDPPSYRSNSEFLSVISREEFEQKSAYYASNPALLVQEDPRALSRAKAKS